MDAQFWINLWNEGRTNFHKNSFHEKLLEYFPLLGYKQGQSVLVPLCGKSMDLLWLFEQKLKVHGIELHERAIEDFFSENSIPGVTKTFAEDFIHYDYENIRLSCGDFFALNETQNYDFVYDRASLVALPSSMRKNYANVIKKSLKVGGKYLLIVYEYDQSKLDGPPFSISMDEVQSLYEDQFTIELLEAQQTINEGARLSSLEELRQVVYLLEKIA